jgi:hypothetical protein
MHRWQKKAFSSSPIGEWHEAQLDVRPGPKFWEGVRPATRATLPGQPSTEQPRASSQQEG